MSTKNIPARTTKPAPRKEWFELDSEVGTVRLALDGLRAIDDELDESHTNRQSIGPSTAFLYSTALNEYMRMIEGAAGKMDAIVLRLQARATAGEC
jgi:hypothetical protein